MVPVTPLPAHEGLPEGIDGVHRRQKVQVGDPQFQWFDKEQ